MASTLEQVKQLGAGISQLTEIVVDLAAEFKAFKAAVTVDQESPSPEMQTALDEANVALAAAKARLQELDVEIGDADSADGEPAAAPGPLDSPTSEFPIFDELGGGEVGVDVPEGVTVEPADALDDPDAGTQVAVEPVDWFSNRPA
ncbi:hypothetical protein [Actinoplanes sp. URMC 104]|uniref:hypothetical protein n=1 Tax=Actinoplanes sp. URMC 104 TaxID=3423409 RepID=UPI003F19F2FB